MSGGTDDQELIDLASLTDDQRAGLACINCGTARGAMRSIATPRNSRAPRVVAHVDTGLCLRSIAGYVVGLHVRLLDAAEHTVTTLAQAYDASDP